jgi:hypothetical protein
MIPRGYTGAAEAYVGLDRELDAISILEIGLLTIGEDASIQSALDNLIGIEVSDPEPLIEEEPYPDEYIQAVQPEPSLPPELPMLPLPTPLPTPEPTPEPEHHAPEPAPVQPAPPDTPLPLSPPPALTPPPPEPTPTPGISDEILGVYVGSYTASQGETGLTLTVFEENGTYRALFEFYNLPGNSNAEHGSYYMNVSYDSNTGQYVFRPTTWIVRPALYIMLGLQGTLTDNVLEGVVENRWTFRVTRA